ncbi:MAG: glycosyltransferase [bacterium]|uniref:Glycosyltransferase n=1 Tax=Candidatus Aphodosoma intestinipullorum TaxID=2840674 RepID=A0A940IEN2_9BACT|nr:glycosyltransferase [Candidatus Aphodosoma intestinipullorum]
MPAKRVLILCDPFAPPLYSPRIMSLCGNIGRYGWEAVIVTERLPYVDYSTSVCRMVQVPYIKSHGWLSRVEWVAKKVADILFGSKERWFVRQVEKCVKVSSFDLIFCSTCMTFPLGAAGRLSRRYGLPLVADLRDIIEQYGTTGYMAHSLPRMLGLGEAIAHLYERINIRSRDKVLHCADALISVSPWHRDFLKRVNQNTWLIYNGYDEELFVPRDVVSERFEIVYTGRITDIGFRNPTMLLEALHSLIEDEAIDPSELRIGWYIEEKMYDEIARMSSTYGLGGCTDINGFISRDGVPDLLRRASVVLLLAGETKENGPRGIMTTKFFEALGVEKPILCVRNDGGCLAAVIRETNAGMAATCVDDVRRFILEKYEEWKRAGFTRQHVVPEAKAKFTRQYQARQFVEVFDGCMAQKVVK